MENQTDPECGSVEEDSRRPYTPPQIKSIELLETAAGTCDGGTFGKSVPLPCQQAGS